ncbi:MAG TPA: hypothetical protein DCF84_06390, partial [Bacteroidetes bacterium]|nr:hypothetical protein [Bacteroidota bacterium]
MRCRFLHILWLITILLLGYHCTSSDKNGKTDASNADGKESFRDTIISTDTIELIPDSISGFYGTYPKSLLDTMTVSQGLSLSELLQDHLPYNA